MTNDRWVHLATAPDQLTAEIWIDILKENGIRATIRASDAVSFLGVSPYGCRVQVPESDLSRALDLLPEAEEEEEEEPRN